MHKLNKFFSRCATGLFYCELDCDGNVIPCAPGGNIKLGNILEKGLEQIWVHNQYLNRIRKRNKIKSKCSRC
ncbi:MAG: SPASM domain-containing protein [Candidatus Thorarchaeota archaeon]